MTSRKALKKSKAHPDLAQLLRDALGVSQNGVLRGKSLSRKTREILLRNSYLMEVTRGWYLLSNPMGVGTTTLWYGSYWNFLHFYLEDRFGKEGYCLSAESSLELHTEQNTIPEQIIVLTKKPSNHVKQLLFATSLVLYQDKVKFPKKMTTKNLLNIMTFADAFCGVADTFFQNKPLDAEIALRMMVYDVSEVAKVLIQRRLISAANRIVGALQVIDQIDKAKQIEQSMALSGMLLKPENPFAKKDKFLLTQQPVYRSPFCSRLFALWEKMRPLVKKHFPASPTAQSVSWKANEISRVLSKINELYTQDAYHSLSIEGYQVSEMLIQKVQSGQWHSETHDMQNALAAKGYFLCFQSVLKSLKKIMNGGQAGVVAANDLALWYGELFKPFVTAQLWPAEALLGYRSTQVYIAQSRHLPPAPHTVAAAMNEGLFQLLINEPDPIVRAILGHFIFVFIHPYMDGNGRIARFLMNLHLVAGGYHWVIIRTTERVRYFEALEQASVKNDIEPFVKFIKQELTP